MVGDIRERRKTLAHLPQEVRGPDEKRDRSCDPRIPRTQLRPQCGSEHHRHSDAGYETNDCELDFEPYPERDAEVDPVPRTAIYQDTEEPIHCDHPGDLGEGNGLK